MIIVENLAVPSDRRVWQEAQALARSGWTVSVICPLSATFAARCEIIENIAIYRHSLPAEGQGAVAYLREYAAVLFHEFRLLIKVHRERGFSVIQACNPPDLIFLIVAPFKLLGKCFIFDQHDRVPEMFIAKYRKKGILYLALRFFERCTYWTADFVITASASFRDAVVDGGFKAPSTIEVVYGVPDRKHIHRVEPEPGLRNCGKFVLGYCGIIAQQDGVDNLVRAICELVHGKGFRDFRAIIVGDGPALGSVRELAKELGVADFIVFTGYLSGHQLLSHMCSFDIGVIPDSFNEYNAIISMNKVFDYCALGIPTATYPLKETRRLLGAAGVYAPTFDPPGLSDACLRLMQDDSLRARCAIAAAKLSTKAFVWEKEANKLVQVYERVISAMGVERRKRTPAGS
jgi:glycosyltransferase involved in cell wall biosynthesis